MKKLLSCAVLILALSINGIAQEVKTSKSQEDNPPMAAGLGPEWNMNSRENFGLGVSLAFDYKLPIDAAPFAAGFTASYSNNFYGITIIETAALFRWYFGGAVGLTEGFEGFFLQADLGAFFLFDNSETTPYFLGGLRTGYRFPLGTMFYAEPFGRMGYPFAFGIGALAGITF